MVFVMHFDHNTDARIAREHDMLAAKLLGSRALYRCTIFSTKNLMIFHPKMVHLYKALDPFLEKNAKGKFLGTCL